MTTEQKLAVLEPLAGVIDAECDLYLAGSDSVYSGHVRPNRILPGKEIPVPVGHALAIREKQAREYALKHGTGVRCTYGPNPRFYVVVQGREVRGPDRFVVYYDTYVEALAACIKKLVELDKETSDG